MFRLARRQVCLHFQNAAVAHARGLDTGSAVLLEHVDGDEEGVGWSWVVDEGVEYGRDLGGEGKVEVARRASDRSGRARLAVVRSPTQASLGNGTRWFMVGYDETSRQHQRSLYALSLPHASFVRTELNADERLPLTVT